MALRRYRWTETLRTLKAVLVRVANGQVYRTDTGVFEAFDVANIAAYGIACAETPAGSYWYQCTLPSLGAAEYEVTVFRCVSAALALTDFPIATERLLIDGENHVSYVELADDVAEAVGEAVGETLPDLAELVAEAVVAALPDPWQGDGDVPVDHDYGGTDELRVVQDGAGVDGVAIRAYLAAEYEAGVRVVRGNAVTGSDGRWVQPMMLDADEYALVFSRPSLKTVVKAITVGAP